MRKKSLKQPSTTSYKPTIVSTFSGCGGLDLGFHQAGYETVWANDFAEGAVESLGSTSFHRFCEHVHSC